MKKGCLPIVAVLLILLAAFVAYIDWWSKTPEGVAAHQASVERQARESEVLAKQREEEEARSRAEAAEMGLAQAYAILHDNGTMRDWRSADQLNKTEVAYRLTEQMILRGNARRDQVSHIELYRCIEAAYTADVASTPVEQMASACAVTMGWLRR